MKETPLCLLILCRNGIIKYSQGPHGTRQYWVNLEASGRNKLKMWRKNTTTIPNGKVRVYGHIVLPQHTKRSNLRPWMKMFRIGLFVAIRVKNLGQG